MRNPHVIGRPLAELSAALPSGFLMPCRAEAEAVTGGSRRLQNPSMAAADRARTRLQTRAFFVIVNSRVDLQLACPMPGCGVQNAASGFVNLDRERLQKRAEAAIVDQMGHCKVQAV